MKKIKEIKELELFTYDELNAEARETAEENYMCSYHVMESKENFFEAAAIDCAETLGNGAFYFNTVSYELSYDYEDYVEFEGGGYPLTYLQEHKESFDYTAEEYELVEDMLSQLGGITFDFSGSSGELDIWSCELEEYAFEHELDYDDLYGLLEKVGEKMSDEYEDICYEIKDYGYKLLHELNEFDYDELKEWYYFEDGTTYDLIDNVDSE